MKAAMNNRAGAAAAAVVKWNGVHRPVDKVKHWLWIISRFILLFGICFIIIYPILTKLSLAFRSREDLFDATIVWIPRHFTLDNIFKSMELLNYFKALKNTFILSAGTSILQVVSCALAGYGFARLKFRGSGILFALVVFTIVIPPQTIMIPTYLHFRFFDVFGLVHLFTGKPGVNLLETFWPFFISSATAMGMKNGLYIFIFRQFFRGLPKELEDAAYVDGAGVLKTFYRVMLPNAIPAMATVILFSFVWQWNDDYFTNLYMANSVTLSKMLYMLTWNLLNIRYEYAYVSLLINTATLLAIAPIFLLYMFAQRYFVESIERTGLVG
ncbi:carbohydrate ABC transporter permease [Paenibacillus sp. MBLB4367]|uniref:carbohydrate ABC transporter permease n=1 Tax=Paenibacillus sp. MBLB4367 TaxID=3384767 RepID=UPI003907EAD2